MWSRGVIFKRANSPPRITARRHLSCYVNHFLTCWKFVGQMGPADFQTVAVDSFIVWRPIFPAAKHDAYPFKSESTESGMMGFSALPQLVIAGPGPVRLNDRTAGKLMEGLPEEFRTSQAPVNPNTLTTLLGHGGDSGKLLHLGGAFEAVAVGTESSQKTRSQCGTSSRKAAKQRRIIMLLKQGCDLFVVAMNGFGQQRDLLDQNVDLHRTGQQYGAVLGQGLGLFNVGQQLLQLVIAAISLSFVKLSNRGQTRLLQLLQRRPTLKKRAGARRMQLTKPVQRLRKINLQRRRQLIRQGCPLVHDTATVFGQQLDAAGQRIIGCPNPQMVAMRYQNIQQQIGIAGVILGTTGVKRFSHFRHSDGIDRIQMQKLDMHQRIDQRTPFLLDCNGNGPATEAIAQRLNPALERFRRMVQCEMMPLIAAGFLQRDGMFLIRPIQAHKRYDFDIIFRFQFLLLHGSQCLKPSRQRVAHNPYSRVLEGHHLSIRPAPRTDRARKSPLIVESIGVAIRNATRPVFHKGNSSTKEKRTKKEKENGLWKMPQLWKSAKESVAFGSFSLMRIPTAAWKSLAKALGFSTFTTGRATVNQHGTNFHLRHYKGWPSDQENIAQHPLSRGRGGVPIDGTRNTTPAASTRRLRAIFLVTSPPLLAVMRGGEYRSFQSDTSQPHIAVSAALDRPLNDFRKHNLDRSKPRTSFVTRMRAVSSCF